ncbi:MAG: hypothetical protein GX855_09775 [Firmicutes bacterium]|jgi:hypothetical protein|nr:hypothetical protein [Bacillota bacterium]
MMWTIIPPEVVWEGVEEKPKDIMELEWQGVQMLVEPLQFGQGRIVRLLSTDPKDFLRPELAPGSIINLLPRKQ